MSSIKSPVYTPHSAPWAHPTPSPSPMIRFPVFADELPRDGTLPPLIPQDLFWNVCSPYMEMMFVALQKAIQAHVGHTTQTERVSMGLPPFGCLFKPTPTMPGRRPPRWTMPSEAVCEETGERDQSSRCPSPEQECESPVNDTKQGPGDSSSVSESGGSFLAGSPQKVTVSPVRGWPQRTAQHNPPLHEGGQSDSTNSLLLAPRNKDHEASFQLEGLGRASVEERNSKAGDNEKRVMVCRHWKSKGFCRMGEKCKFLHPEHKRGTGSQKMPTTNTQIARVQCMSV